MRRREVLKLGIGGGAVGALGAVTGCVATQVPPSSRVFSSGVASGLHAPGEVVLWSRVAPERAGGQLTVSWQVAIDESFANVVASGTTTATAATDHTVKVLVGGLPTGADLHYRFRHPVEDSPTGHVRTLPAPGAVTSSLRLAFGSCQAWVNGYYTAWRQVAGLDLDAVLFLGDFIYESGSMHLLGAVRDGQGLEEATNLEGYRALYRLYRSDADLQAAQAAHAFVPVWDDHEVRNDYDRAIFSTEPARVAAAYQAWFEYQPVWPTDGTRIHRSLDFGSIAQVFMLDGRQHRDPSAGSGLPVGFGTLTNYETQVGRTMLGSAQRQWLLDGLEAAEGDAEWKVIGNPVMIAPLRSQDDDTPEARASNPNLPRHAGLYTNSAFDSWDGYVWERDLLLAHLADRGIDNTVFVTGDYHSFWQAGLTPDFDDPGAPLVANEFAAGAISSAGGAINENALFGDAALGTWAPGFNYIDGIRNGYGLLEAVPGSMQVTFMAHSAVSATMLPTPSARFTLASGDPVVQTEVF